MGQEGQELVPSLPKATSFAGALDYKWGSYNGDIDMIWHIYIYMYTYVYIYIYIFIQEYGDVK